MGEGCRNEERFAFVAILYTGAVGNKCGLSKVLRRALFVGIMNSIDKAAIL